LIFTLKCTSALKQINRAKKHIDGLVERMETQLDRELIISDRGYPSEEMIDYYETATKVPMI